MEEKMIFSLPYGKEKVKLQLNKKEVAGVLESNINSYIPEGDGISLVKKAIENPIGSKRLCELSKGKNKVCIIASDHTRPVPSKVIMPLMLD